ncbi:MAG: hypothetical protein PSN34_02555 [Urechidicola sp.]|nr:hypothetical protein [Urechidicola sp.]
MSRLPKYLYRGDADPENKRKLRETFNSGLLLTNLCDGGNGREIFGKSLEHLINKHIAFGWEKTHFLSFTTNEQTAILYGRNGKEFIEIYDDREKWDFTILTFDTSILLPDSINQIETGIYRAEFSPSCREFLPTYKVVLIDTLSYLKRISVDNKIDLSTAIKKAENDNEWLILPASPFGNGEFTAKLDTACITERRIYCNV